MGALEMLPKKANYQSVTTSDVEEAKKDENEKKDDNVGLSIAFGLVGAAMCSPVMMSFASIIFSDSFFRPYMPSLVKLVLFSAAVHQLCYVATSTLPFAVGQVQDAGLIFLSAMARKIVVDGGPGGGVHGGGMVGGISQEEVSKETTLAAALWTLGLATAGLGVMLIVIGRLKLASLAQYLPVPVVGGYLGFIGFYCGQAGLALMSGVEVVRLRDYRHLMSVHALTRIAPGFGVAIAIKVAFILSSRYNASRTARALIIPSVLLSTVVAFYAILLATGSTLQDARDAGWVGQAPDDSSDSSSEDDSGGRGLLSYSCFAPWRMYFPEDAAVSTILMLVLRCLPKVAIVWVGMVLVVAFSSSLDIAAIEMELGRPLNYDAELCNSVGLGNLVSGLAGGFSGSYIFSQTILNLRSHVADRRSGLIVAFVELGLVFLVPIPPTALAPTCAFGGTLLVIAIELMDEWLVKARSKFSTSEFAVDVFTFGAIHLLGLEAGFAAGLVAAGLAFAASSAAQGGAVTLEPSAITRSVVMRDFEQRAFLSNAVRKNDIVVLQLKGFVFFGAAANVLAQFKLRLHLVDFDSSQSAKRGDALDTTLYRRLRARITTGETPRTPPPSRLGISVRAAAVHDDPISPRFVVVDCRDFAGVDATAARACFLPLLRMLRDAGSVIYFAGLWTAVAKTLTGHGVHLEHTFPNLDAALERAEDGVLRSDFHGYTSFRSSHHKPDALPPRRPPRQTSEPTSPIASLFSVSSSSPPPPPPPEEQEKQDTLVAILSDYLFANTRGIPAAAEIKARSVSADAEEETLAETLQTSAAKLSGYFENSTLQAGTTLLAASVAPDRLFFIASGVVDFEYEGEDHHKKRILRVTRGGVCGELNFFLRRPQRFACRVIEDADVFILHRRDADAMRSQDPDLFILLQTGLLKNLCLQVEDSLGSSLFSHT